MHVFKNEFLGFMRGCSGSTDKVGSIHFRVFQDFLLCPSLFCHCLFFFVTLNLFQGLLCHRERNEVKRDDLSFLLLPFLFCHPELVSGSLFLSSCNPCCRQAFISGSPPFVIPSVTRNLLLYFLSFRTTVTLPQLLFG